MRRCMAALVCHILDDTFAFQAGLLRSISRALFTARLAARRGGDSNGCFHIHCHSRIHVHA